MKTLLFYLGFALFLVSTPLLAQPAIQWQQSYGGSAASYTYKNTPTNDGGYIMVGETKAHDGDVTNHTVDTTAYAYNFDIWVVKTDAMGLLQWQTCLGGRGYDCGSSIIQTSDGGYMVSGVTASVDGQVTGNRGPYDAWLVKLDNVGNLQWQKCYGGTAYDKAEDVKQTADGGYIVAATTGSNDGDVSGNHGSYDVWILKIDAVGTIQWQKCYGGTNNESFFSANLQGGNAQRVLVQITNDGAYIFTTSTTSNDGDVIGHHGIAGSITINSVGYFNGDFWVVKLDTVGTIQWQKSLGGTNPEYPFSIVQSSDGGYAIAGATLSNDGDVTIHHAIAPNQPYDVWVVKLDNSGMLQWQKDMGGSRNDEAFSVSETSDGGYFVTGKTESSDGDVAGQILSGAYHCWAVKTDNLGTIQWQKCLNHNVVGYSSFQTPDDGYMVSGIGSRMGMIKLYPVSNHVITGTVFEDLNANCIKDTNEVGLYGELVEAMPGGYFASTDANGNYTLFVDSGFYTVTHTPTTYYNHACTVTYTANINSVTPTVYGDNFGDTLRVHCADLKVSIGTPYFRQCFKNILNVSYSNFGAVAAYNVSVSLNFDSHIIPISSSVPYAIVGGNYVFTIDTVKAGQMGSFTVLDSVSCAAVVGLYTSCVFVTIHSANTAECDTLNNCAHDCHYIVGSCDPNAKEVAISNTAFTTQENCTATDTLAYTIRFQNTGTFSASTIVIRDTLSTNLNVASVESDASSFPYTFRIYGQGILEWTFDNINLPDSTTNEVASHGFVKFTVRQKPNNLQGTVIKNSASIIFDYNNAVLTDTAIVTIPQQTTGVENNGAKNKNVIVYPNPTNNIVIVKSATELGLVTIYNVVGAVVYIQKVNASEQQIDLSKQASGIYFLQTQNTYIKIIKE